MSLQGDNRPPVLLVDGYNLLGKLAGYNSEDSDEESEAKLSAAFADGPRLALQNRLCEYSHLRQVKVSGTGSCHSLTTLIFYRRAVPISACRDRTTALSILRRNEAATVCRSSAPVSKLRQQPANGV